MKKLLALLIVAGMASFVACGPSQKELEAKEKAKQDSIAAAEKAKQEADSLAFVEKEKARIDSLRADSIAQVDKKKQNQPRPQGNKKPDNKTNEQKVKEKVKAGRG